MSAMLTWWYHDASGRQRFQHYRCSRVPTPGDPRTKTYGYRYLVGHNDWRYQKPPGADALIYRLPEVLAYPEARLILTEGERDADAARAQGALASCHHGGAGKFTQAMAESLAGHRGKIVLVADNDPAGAYDVCRRYDLLRGVGIPASRLRVREVVPTHPGADLRDHLEAGFGVKDLRRADLGRLRAVAQTSTGASSEGSWPYACTPEEAEQLRNWRPQVVSRPTSPTKKGRAS